jgi:hypothetical protein
MVHNRSLKLLLVLVIAFGFVVFFGTKKAAAFGLNPNPPLVNNTGPPPYGIPAYEKDQLENCNYLNYGISPAFRYWVGVFGANGSDETTVTYGAQTVDLNFNWASTVCQNLNEVPESRLKIMSVDVVYVNPDGTDGSSAGYIDNIGAGSVVTLNNGGPTQGDYRASVDDFQYHPNPGQGIDSIRKIRIRFRVRAINNITNPGNAPTGYRCIQQSFVSTNGWDFNPCEEGTISRDIQIYVDPWGSIQGASCNLGPFDTTTGRNQDVAIKGYAQDLDYYPTEVQVYMDKRAKGTPGPPALTDLAFIGTYGANNSAPGVPVGPGPPAAFHDWWMVPTADIARYNDAYRHDFIINVVDKRSDGSVEGQARLGVVTIGPCAMPQCGSIATTPSGDIEVNTPFDARANFNYSPGSSGIAVHNDIGLDVPDGTRVATVSNRYFANGNTPINLYAQPIPGGSTISNEVAAFNLTFTNPGTYNIVWRIQWVAPADSDLLNGLRNNHNAGGPYDYYQSGSNFYATLRCSNSKKAGRMPYYKVYGNDAAVGYGFDDGTSQCSSPSGNATFRGFNKGGASYDYMRGTGAQFGLFALGVIQEVPSSGMKAGDALNDQTFANTNIVGSVKTPKSDYGGQGGLGSCIPDYFSRNTIPGSGAQVSSVTPGGITAGDQNGNGATISYVSPSAGNSYVTINTATLANNKKHTVYVNGDAVIAGNIIYANFGSIDNAPNFTLIVKGNIYIDNQTAQLDGLYIAQPLSDGSKGKIITCANGNSQIAGNLMAISGANGCANKLTVNGSFIAKEVKLLRTNGSLSNGLANPDTIFNFTFGSIVPAPSPISADCMRIEEGSDWASRGTWHDNGLCTDPGAVSRYGLEWVPFMTAFTSINNLKITGTTPNTSNENYKEEISDPRGNGKTCVMFKEPSEWFVDNTPPYTNATSWEDNYLCYNNAAGHNLKFYYGGPKPFPGAASLNSSAPGWANSVMVSPNNTWQGTNQIVGDPSYGKQVR